MRYLSLFSGIEAATAAWKPLGWEPVAFSEIDKFPCAVLKHPYPSVPNLGDVTKLDARIYQGVVDVVVGGSPCQPFSISGMRKGLRDARGNLTLEYASIVNEVNPKYVVWENVPGVLSDKTNAFGCLLAALSGENDPLIPPGGKWTDAGYVLGPERAVAWRCLDAQYFGLAQRRKRVFVIACPRNGADPRTILFESDGLRRDTPPSRNQKKEDSFISGESLAFGGGNQAGSIDVATTTKTGLRLDFDSDTFICFHPTQDPISNAEDICHSRGCGSSGGACTAAIAFTQNQCGDVLVGGVIPALGTNQNATGRNSPKVFWNWLVRRLTPKECERLQGFSDDYTNIPYGRPKWEGEICPDGHRYKVLGNSMAVNVMRWIGRRIQTAEEGRL